MKHKRWPKGSWMKLKSPATLRALIDQKGFSYADVARYVGCHKSFIGALANTNPQHGKRSCTSRVAERIAEVLDVPVEVLFDPGPSTVGQHSVARQRTHRSLPNGAPAA